MSQIWPGQDTDERDQLPDGDVRIERVQLLNKGNGAPFKKLEHFGVESPLAELSSRSYSIRRWCNAKVVVGAVTGALIIALAALAVVGIVRNPNGNLAPGLQEQIRRSVPAGVPIKIPISSGQPIKQGPKTLPNDTVYERLPKLDDHIDYGNLLKPRYHLTAPKGWMNDPNGMLQHPSGMIHVFYQWNPDRPQWGSPWWGHVVTQDLTRWTRLPPALRPDKWFDKDGVFSGSATVLPDGTPYMLYTGVMNYSQYGFYYQTQAAALPLNASDPLLVNWTKTPIEMNIPPGGTHAQFRDPTTAWPVNSVDAVALRNALGLPPVSQPPSHTSKPELRGRLLLGAASDTQAAQSNNNRAQAAAHASAEVVVGKAKVSKREARSVAKQTIPDVNGTWLTAVGVLDDCLGAAALYMSTDSLRTWLYVGTLYSQLAQNYTQFSTCLPDEADRDGGGAPPGSRGFGGHCDQFGETCRMWECPDFFNVGDNVQAFKYSDQSRARIPFAADYYVLGDAQSTNYTLALIQDGKDAYSGKLDGNAYQPRSVDYGVVYASKSFRLKNGRLLWLGWVYEDSLGCSEVCADGTPFIVDRQKWQGAQTLLREISYVSDTQTLAFMPIPETKELRQLPALVSKSYKLDSHKAAKVGQPATQVLLDGIEPQAVSGTENGGKLKSVSGGRQLELSMSISMSGDAVDEKDARQPFNVTLRIHTGNKTFTDVVLNGTALLPTNNNKGKAEAPTLDSLFVYVDRRYSGGMTSDISYGGPVPLPVNTAKPYTQLNLLMYVDRSILEVYVQYGVAVVTSRVYSTPLLPQGNSNWLTDSGQPDWNVLGSWGYELVCEWQHGKVHADVSIYDLDHCWEGHDQTFANE